MAYESEQALENKLISFLIKNGYERVVVNTVEELEGNSKKQLEKHNKKTLSSKEFLRV